MIEYLNRIIKIGSWKVGKKIDIENKVFIAIDPEAATITIKLQDGSRGSGHNGCQPNHVSRLAMELLKMSPTIGTWQKQTAIARAEESLFWQNEHTSYCAKLNNTKVAINTIDDGNIIPKNENKIDSLNVQHKLRQADCNCEYRKLDKFGQCQKGVDLIDQAAHLDKELPFICEYELPLGGQQ